MFDHARTTCMTNQKNMVTFDSLFLNVGRKERGRRIYILLALTSLN